MTNEMHNFYNQFLFHSFLSALHVSNESSRLSSGARHNILYYTVQSVQSVQSCLQHDCTDWDFMRRNLVDIYRRFEPTYQSAKVKHSNSSWTSWAKRRKLTTNLRCITSQKNQYFIHNAAKAWNHAKWKTKEQDGNRDSCKINGDFFFLLQYFFYYRAHLLNYFPPWFKDTARLYRLYQTVCVIQYIMLCSWQWTTRFVRNM